MVGVDGATDVTIRVTVDRELCSGYANCLDAAPDLFALDEHDVAVVVGDHDALEAHREQLEYAAKLCPRQAILIDEID
jgi:ferredoxin